MADLVKMRNDDGVFLQKAIQVLRNTLGAISSRKMPGHWPDATLIWHSLSEDGARR